MVQRAVAPRSGLPGDETYGRGQLPPIAGREVFEASKRFRLGTALSVDTLHPRHCAQLGEEYCERVAALPTVVEKKGLLFDELDAFCIAMLIKLDGGHPPIGILQSFIRIWGKVRRRHVAAWEVRRASRTFFFSWGCQGKSAQASVWAQAF